MTLLSQFSLLSRLLDQARDRGKSSETEKAAELSASDPPHVAAFDWRREEEAGKKRDIYAERCDSIVISLGG